MPSMLVTIDRVGRVVIPKDIRDRLALGSDAELEVDLEGDSIRLTPVRQRGRQMVVRDGLAVLEPIEGFVITDADVQRWRDADQR
jgi:AbrB family looped-hinge helix DNA binding protein